MQFLYRLLLGIMGALIAAEILLRFLPVSTSTETGYYITPSILTYPAHHQVVMASGWNLSNAHQHRSNNYGFLTHRDFLPNANAIALIGDSYVEANMLTEDDRLNTQLENKLGRIAPFMHSAVLVRVCWITQNEHVSHRNISEYVILYLLSNSVMSARHSAARVIFTAHALILIRFQSVPTLSPKKRAWQRKYYANRHWPSTYFLN